MKIRKALLAATALPLLVAFQNNPGWKMDGDKLALDSNGNPIWINSNGDEQAVKGDTIATLNSEAKNHRTAKEKAEADLAKYKGKDGKLIDPETAIKAIDTVANIDAKKLIDAGEVERVRTEIADQYKTQLSEAQNGLTERDRTIAELRIDSAFNGSEFVRDRLAVPADMFRAAFGKNVKLNEDGKTLEFYGRDGNRLLSKKNAGEYATGDEAFELMVEQHPQKDTIIKAPEASGSGAGGGGGNRPGARTMKRADFEGLQPGKAQADAAAAMAKGELTIVD